MGRTCVVADCHSKYKDASIKVSHHEFPSDAGIRGQWIDAIRFRIKGARERQEAWTPSDLTTVCSFHFLETDYLEPEAYEMKRRRLKPTAVPTVFVSQDVCALQVLANQAVMEQAIQDENSFISLAPPLRQKRTYSAVPRYRRGRRQRNSESDIKEASEGINLAEVDLDVADEPLYVERVSVMTNDANVVETDGSAENMTFTTIEEVIAFVEGRDDEEEVGVISPTAADHDPEGHHVECGSPDYYKQEKDNLQAEMTFLQRKLAMAQLSMKAMEKRLEMKSVKKSRAMGRSYYYEKKCKVLGAEVKALKAREEELMSTNVPVLKEIEMQAALGDVQAMFMMQQIRHFGKGERARPQWEDAILEKCSAWLNKSHLSYNFAKHLGLFLLPSRSTLGRFAEWKSRGALNASASSGTSVSTAGNDIIEQSLQTGDSPDPDDHDEEEELLKRQQEELRSVEMMDDSERLKALIPDDNGDSMVTCMDIATTMDALNQFTDGDSQVTIITLDPTTGVMEWRLDASTAQEVVEMTASGEMHLENADDT